MDSDEVTTAMRCFVRVAWCAASGHLHYALPAASGEEAKSAPSPSKRPKLQAGLCLVQSEISEKNASIASAALKLIVLCASRHRDAFSVFRSLPLVSDFIIDVLIGCAHSDVRNAALDCFFQLSTVNSQGPEAVMKDSPRHFLLHVLLKTSLPLWPAAGMVRGERSARVLLQSFQYFELRGRLLQQLTLEDQQDLDVDVREMLELELDWLSNPDLAESASKIDCLLLP